MRILIAGILGGIAMFAWTSIAHMATPLGWIGFSELQEEASVLPALETAAGSKPGLYIFPWMDPGTPDAEKAYSEKVKTTPSGLLLFRPAGAGLTMTPAMLGVEFAKEATQALIAAFLLSMTTIAAFAMRVSFVALIHVSAAIATNVSYWNWYGYPLDYTGAQIVIEVVSGLAAGVVIALMIKPQAA
ncbi:MAG: hypothetical protein ABL973_08730 [Micropepsaceae bacterium]